MNFPLVNTIWPVVTIIATYLYVVLRGGPKYMELRKAYDLKAVIRIYNIVQVIANGGYFIAVVSVHFDINCDRTPRIYHFK